MRRMHAWAILSILLLGAFLRLWISDFTLILLDYDAFYHARIAEHIYQNHHVPTWDAGELGGIPHYYPPGYPLAMAVANHILHNQSPIVIGSLLTVFFGVLGTLFVYIIGRDFSEKIALTSAFIHAITPILVLRSGLWARPTGISMLLAIMLVYLFLRIAKKRDGRYTYPALIITASYVFTHSSALFVLFLVFAASTAAMDRHTTKTFVKIALVPLFAGGLYYYRFLPFLNFSISGKGEYMPLTQPLIQLYPFGDLGTFGAALLFLGTFNLAVFPVVFHGIYEMLRRKKEIGLIALFSMFIILFKANLFMLLNFALPIAIAVSVYRIQTTRGRLPAVLLFLVIVGMDAALLLQSHGEKKAANADVVEEILSGVQLTKDNLVLSSDPNTGHAIPYYTGGSTFLSDLTDTLTYDKNREAFDIIIDKDTGTKEAMALLLENNIDHVLIIGEPLPFMKESQETFILIKEIEKNGVKASLYMFKK